MIGTPNSTASGRAKAAAAKASTAASFPMAETVARQPDQRESQQDEIVIEHEGRHQRRAGKHGGSERERVALPPSRPSQAGPPPSVRSRPAGIGEPRRCAEQPARGEGALHLGEADGPSFIAACASPLTVSQSRPHREPERERGDNAEHAARSPRRPQSCAIRRSAAGPAGQQPELRLDRCQPEADPGQHRPSPSPQGTRAEQGGDEERSWPWVIVIRTGGKAAASSGSGDRARPAQPQPGAARKAVPSAAKPKGRAGK